MKQILRCSTLAALLFCTFNISAQDKKLADFTKEDFIKDFDLTVKILQQQHPHLYKFTDSVTFVRRVDSLRNRITAHPDISTFLTSLPTMLIKDVHLSFSLSGDHAKELYASMRFFPLPVLIERENMIINIKGAEVPFGAEVVSINNITVKDILHDLSVHAYSDGYIRTGMDRLYRNFQLYFSLKYPKATEYDIAWMEPGSRTVKHTRLPATDPTKAYHSSSRGVFPLNLLQREYPVYDNYFDEQQTGLLTVNTFNIGEAEAYKTYSTFFKEANKRKYKQVIIDVRSNSGGSPHIAALLYSFLAEAPFRNVYNYRTGTIDISYPEYTVDDNNRGYSDEDIRNDRNFYYQRYDKDSTGFYVGNARLREGMLENFPPDKDAFRGKVYILTGGGTVSAATYFAALVQQNKRGLIIGKETGSGAASTTAAWFLNYRLPGTKSILTIPRTEIFFFNAVKDNGRGIIPDKEVPLPEFMQYMRAGEDPELNYTMDIIRKRL